MKIEGHHDLPMPRERAWDALLDRGRLERAIPGCERLDAVGPDEYRAVLTAGVGAVKGTFEGTVRLSDKEPPSRYAMALAGSGGPGFVRGAAAIELAEVEGGTRVTYRAEVQVGGLVAGVGQRVLAGVAKLMVSQFFSRIAGEPGSR